MFSPLRFNIKSTVDMEAILNRQLIAASVLPLERGSLDGVVQILPLVNIALVLVELNKKVAFCADRKAGKFLFSLNLSDSPALDGIVAQGVLITKPAIFGFNENLKDLDLQLSAGCRFCSIIVPEHFFAKKMTELGCFFVMKDILSAFNILTNSNVSSCFVQYLNRLWQNMPSLDLSPQLIEEEILSILIDCFIGHDDRKVGLALPRRDRHEAALQVLALANSSATKPFEVNDLCSLLHQSRTSLFNGCKEKFKMSPLQVLRSVRLHQVRHALLDAEFCIENNLCGVNGVASHFGFVGRSHFARHYKQEFLEMPSQTLLKRRHADQSF